MSEPAALFRRCCELLSQRDPRAASLLPELEAHPHYAPGWRQLAATLLGAGQVEAALVAASRAVTAMPDDGAGHVLHGQALARAGRRAEAVAALRRATRLAPSDARAWFSLGLLHQDFGAHDEAVEAYTTALAADPKRHEAALNLGIALQHDGQFEAAMVAYGACYRLHGASFGRIAQALVSAPSGRLFLDLDDLRAALA